MDSTTFCEEFSNRFKFRVGDVLMMKAERAAMKTVGLEGGLRLTVIARALWQEGGSPEPVYRVRITGFHPDDGVMIDHRLIFAFEPELVEAPEKL